MLGWGEGGGEGVFCVGSGGGAMSASECCDGLRNCANGCRWRGLASGSVEVQTAAMAIQSPLPCLCHYRQAQQSVGKGWVVANTDTHAANPNNSCCNRKGR